MFAFMIAITVIPLCILRYMHKLSKGKILLEILFVFFKLRIVSEKKLMISLRNKGCCSVWLRKLWMLSAVDITFWPLVLYPVYLTFGPWSIGYLVEDHIGVVFAWGIFVNGTFLPGSFTYAYGFIQVVVILEPP